MVNKKSLVIGLLSTSIISMGVIGCLIISKGPNETETIPNKVNYAVAVTETAHGESTSKNDEVIEEQTVTTTNTQDVTQGETKEETTHVATQNSTQGTTTTTKKTTTTTTTKVTTTTTTQISRDYYNEALWVKENAIAYGESIGLTYMDYLDRSCNYRTGYNGYVASWSTKEEALATETKALDELKAKGCIGFNIIVVENEYGNGGWQCCACGG